MDHARGPGVEDEEKNIGGNGSNSPVLKTGTVSVVNVNEVGSGPQHGADTPAPRGILAKLRHYEDILDRKLGIEVHSIVRKKPEERDPKFRTWQQQALMMMMWFSSCCNLACFTTGFIGYEFGLDLKTTLLIIFFGNILGTMLPVSAPPLLREASGSVRVADGTQGFCAVLGVRMGLRSVSMMRYSMGWYGAKLIAVFNVVEQCGWTAVGAITGGLALSAVTNCAIGSALGVVILAVVSLFLSLIGVKGVMRYEKYSGIVYFVIFLIMYGQAAYVADFSTAPELGHFEGGNRTAGILSMVSIMYASSASWGSIIADFYVDYPVNTRWYKVAGLTMAGICMCSLERLSCPTNTTPGIPSVTGMSLGAIVASCLHSNPVWKEAYDDKMKGIGFLVQHMLHPTPFAKVCLTILSMSSLGMMSLSLYSIGIAIQQLGRPVAKVPRFIYTALAFTAVTLLGVIGAERLIPFLVNFLSLLGYWATAYIMIVVLEHYLFRSGYKGYSMYNLEVWNDPSQLPVGWAGCSAFILGLVGAIFGMSEAWHQGPLAKLIGSNDIINGRMAHFADIGNEVCFVVTVLVFIPVRWLELRIMKR